MQKSLASHLAVLCILATSPLFAIAQAPAPHSNLPVTHVAKAGQHAPPGQISFYGDIGGLIGSPYAKNPLLVRPANILLAEDGSVSLDDLHWKGWGLSVARATGFRDASTCRPDCASGKRVRSAAQFTLWSPGRVHGHRVYRCFRLAIPSLTRFNEQECIRREGTLYGYMPVSTPPPHGAAHS